MKNTKKEFITVRSVDRALKIVKCFTHTETELSLSEISEKVGLAKSTVHRLLDSLENANFVEQDDETGKYKLSFELIRLGAIASESINLQKIARAEMEVLSQKSGQTSNLYMIKDYQRLCIAQVPGPQYIKRYSYLGALLPLYAGASGKVLLAYQNQQWLENYFDNVNLIKITDNTITDKNQLLEELNQIRKQGYAVSLSERDPISASVSAPVFDYSGKLVAALTVSGPTVMFTEENINSYVKYLLEAAKNISSRLGYKCNQENFV